MLAEADAGLDRDVHARPAWNAVGDDGAGDGVCNREIVRKQSVLRTFVIVRRDEQKTVAPMADAVWLSSSAWDVSLEPQPAMTLQRPET